MQFLPLLPLIPALVMSLPTDCATQKAPARAITGLHYTPPPLNLPYVTYDNYNHADNCDRPDCETLYGPNTRNSIRLGKEECQRKDRKKEDKKRDPKKESVVISEKAGWECDLGKEGRGGKGGKKGFERGFRAGAKLEIRPDGFEKEREDEEEAGENKLQRYGYAYERPIHQEQNQENWFCPECHTHEYCGY